jgi:urea transport system permease protein
MARSGRQEIFSGVFPAFFSIELTMSQETITQLQEIISNSLSFSSILVLTAIGLAITFGVMRVINMAHGEMLMLGAYTAFVVTDPHWLSAWLESTFGWDVHFSIYVAIPVSFLVVGFVGYLMEVLLIRHLYGRPLDTLLATWGVGLVLQQLVNLKFGANLNPMHLPESLDGHLRIGALEIPYYRIFIFIIALLCLLLVYLWFFKTSSGLKIRAVVQNRPMASALGISTRRVDSLTFAFASGLAGVAGCILAHLYNVKYTMGNDYIIDAFMVVILGGMGQLAGSVAGAATIGTSTAVVEKWAGSLPMAKVYILLIVVVFLLIRPSGLFALKERSYE